MILFKQTILFAFVTALSAASLPLVSVSAEGANDPTPPPRGELTDERLEKIWARQLRLHKNIGKTEGLIRHTQQLINRAAQNGKDVSAVQAALDAFKDAVDDAKPLYDGAQEIVDSHAGFDANGKVTDDEQAKETIRAMGEKLKEIKDAMGGAGKVLREAIQAFREANPKPERTPTP